MEQYIHTLIAADSAYVPQPAKIAEFFSLLATLGFEMVRDASRSLPGLRVMKPGTRTRVGWNSVTSEVFAIVPVHDQISVDRPHDIPALIEGLREYRVSGSGEWPAGCAPIYLFKSDKTPFEETAFCEVSCNVSPAPVSTSSWDSEAGPNVRNVPAFGEPCMGRATVGIFPNPWTGEVIEVQNAGCARFWIEFEFGKFLYPEIQDNLEVLKSSLVHVAMDCFHIEFNQGCRFW